MWFSRPSGNRRRGTTLTELRSLFEKGLTASSVSESLMCRMADDEARAVRRDLETLGFDVVGIKNRNSEGAVGWVSRSDLQVGTCLAHLQPFAPHQLVAESTPLSEVIHILADEEHVFVVSGQGISGIITRADLNKPPVRALLFTLITLLEMHLTYWIGQLFPDESWSQHLSESRLRNATEMLKKRRSRAEDISLLECLQLCDKRDIIRKSEEYRDHLALGSSRQTIKILDRIEKLRDHVAHAQEDLAADWGWPSISSSISDIERMVNASDDALANVNSHQWPGQAD